MLSTSKKEIEKVVEEKLKEVSYGEGFVSPVSITNRLNGKLFELVELLGLEEKRENAFKDSIRNTVWREFSDRKIARIPAKEYTRILLLSQKDYYSFSNETKTK